MIDFKIIFKNIKDQRNRTNHILSYPKTQNQILRFLEMTEVDRRCFDKIQHQNFPIEEKKMTPGNGFFI